MDKELIITMKNAVKQRSLQKVKWVVEQDRNILDVELPLGNWLYMACDYESLELVSYFLDCGIDINKPSGVDNQYPVGVAASKGNEVIVDYLLSRGAEVLYYEAKNSPILAAVDGKNLNIVKKMIKKGFDVNRIFHFSYGDGDLLGYATKKGVEEICVYLQRLTGKKIQTDSSIVEKIQYNPTGEHKIVKEVLKKKFSTAIEEIVDIVLKRYFEEEVFAMSFRMHYQDENKISRYLCETIIQTKQGYEQSMKSYSEKYGDPELQLFFKYIPEEYKYSENSTKSFFDIRKYLYENCINMEECEKIQNQNKYKEMKEAIKQENIELEKILAETISELRKRNIFKNNQGTQFYVFPYIGEEDSAEHFIPIAKKMNEGLDLKEYIEYFEEKNS